MEQGKPEFAQRPRHLSRYQASSKCSKFQKLFNCLTVFKRSNWNENIFINQLKRESIWESYLPSIGLSFKYIPLIWSIPFFFINWNVKKSATTDLMNWTTCLPPVTPGPSNVPTISLVVSFFVPALTSRFSNCLPQQSSRFLTVTLVIVSFLFNCMRSHGLSSFLEWKKLFPPFQANFGSRFLCIEEAQASMEVISAEIKLNSFKLLDESLSEINN